MIQTIDHNTDNNTDNNLDIPSRLINNILSIKPLADFAKNQARQMIIKRAEKMGIRWREESMKLRSHHWEEEMQAIHNPSLQYPDYYTCSFHAYEKGNLSWEAASEVEVASLSVHATILPEAGLQGDRLLRKSYHDIITTKIAQPPKDIVDLGCSTGLSSFALQESYPQAQITGVELSPYFLSVANYRGKERNTQIKWVNAPAENTGLPDGCCDLVSLCLVCHELPQIPTRQIFQEARRLLRSQGHIAIMDMNPQAEAFVKMKPYVLTLLKSTEPYLDQYFSLDIAEALINAGFQAPSIQSNSRRHRTVIAQVQS